VVDLTTHPVSVVEDEREPRQLLTRINEKVSILLSAMQQQYWGKDRRVFRNHSVTYPGEASHKKHGGHSRRQVLEALNQGKWPGRLSFNLTVRFCWEVLWPLVWYFLGEDQGYSQSEGKEQLKTHTEKRQRHAI
jgi:hypothetical protein